MVGEKEVIGQVQQLLAARNIEFGELGLDTELYQDGLGLESLDAAELSARLEEEFGTDPYSEGELPLTVGDIVRFYAS